jgi:hypothetical protein
MIDGANPESRLGGINGRNEGGNQGLTKKINFPNQVGLEEENRGIGCFAG